MLQSCAKTVFLLFVLVLWFPVDISAQSCDDDSPGLLGFLFDLADDYEVSDTTSSEPIIRTEDFELKYGVNFMMPKLVKDLRPTGLDVALFHRVTNTKNLYLGGSFSFHQYGIQTYDTLIGDYERIVTANRIYGLNFLAKYKLIDFKFIQAYIGVQAGLLFFETKSRMMDDLPVCEGGEVPRKLHSFNTLNPNIGLTFGVQIPVFSYYDRLSIDIGYQMPGQTTYVRQEDVDIRPHDINYQHTTNNLNMLSIQIGLSHYF